MNSMTVTYGMIYLISYKTWRINEKKKISWNIINGQEFIVEDYEDVRLENPWMTFYVTDISPQYKGLEITIMDNEPSDDPATCFLTYKDGELTHIGGVGGFSFKKECGYNGFAYEGEVIGEIVMGFTYTCWGGVEDEYTILKRRIWNIRIPIVTQISLKIYINYYGNLTVYLKMDEDPLTTIIAAQGKVFSGMGFSG